MQVTVKYFASLRELMGISEHKIEIDTNSNVADLWRQLTADKSNLPQVLYAVNKIYVAEEHQLQAGDEVAFFPPVTGG